jgi:Mrp family chromosome partitioning ATPase
VTQPATRTIIVVGDPTIATLLSYVPVAWTVHRADNIAGLVEGRRNGTLPKVPDGVIMTDLTGDTRKELVNGIGTMLMSRVPVAVIAYDPDNLQFLIDTYPKLEESILSTHAQWLARMADNGEPVPEADRVNPLATTYLTLTDTAGGASQLLREFGPNLRDPLTEDEVAALGPQYARPFPRPTAGAGFGATDAAKGRAGRVLTVISDKGGCGKSSVALMLASSIAYHTYRGGQPKSVVVVDMDRQSQLGSQFPSAVSGVSQLKANSSADEVMSALHHVADVDNVWLLLGGRRTGDHLALRTVELYAHVVPILASMFDVVIVDGSVGTTSDPVTAWAQQHSDGVYYVLDQSTESLALAVDARDNTVLPVELGGLGLDAARFKVIENRVLLDLPAWQRNEWNRAVAARLGEAAVEAVIPDSHPEVTMAKSEENGVLYLVQTSDVLREPLRLLAKRIFPDIVPDPEPGPADAKKRFWAR